MEEKSLTVMKLLSKRKNEVLDSWMKAQLSSETLREEKIIVKADPDIADMIPWYLEKMQEDIKALNEALEKTDYEKIKVTAHRMKGSGANYGFDDISELGKKLERSAGEENAEEIKQFLGDLTSYFDRIEVQYDQKRS